MAGWEAPKPAFMYVSEIWVAENLFVATFNLDVQHHASSIWWSHSIDQYFAFPKCFE